MDDARQRIDDLVNRGLLDQWYAVAKSVQVKPGRHAPPALGRDLVLWRDAAAGSLNAWRITARTAARGCRAVKSSATTSPAAITA